MRTERLVVTYPGQTERVLDEVDLTVAAGSFTVVVGPSGCGKSTLLNCLAGLVPATAGRVLDGDRPVDAPDPRRGVVFQRDVLFPWMDIAGNLDFALRPTGLDRASRARRSGELLDAVQLHRKVLRRRPYELSGGMRQRVGIARMLAGEPDVMLMDEPFAALDAQTRLQMQDLVTEIWSESKRTVVFVTHDVDEAIRLASTIVVLDAGRVSQTLTNPLPRPRPADRLAELAGYPEMRRRLHGHLAAALH